MGNNEGKAYFEAVKGVCLGCRKELQLVKVIPLDGREPVETSLCGVCLTGCADYSDIRFWATKDNPVEGF